VKKSSILCLILRYEASIILLLFVSYQNIVEIARAVLECLILGNDRHCKSSMLVLNMALKVAFKPRLIEKQRLHLKSHTSDSLL